MCTPDATRRTAVAMCGDLKRIGTLERTYITCMLFQMTEVKPHHKNWFAARCEYLHLNKNNSQQAHKHCEFFLIRCKHSQRAANQFLRGLEKRLNVLGPVV